ncbi:MAG: NADH-quinone oxidoreductase subunit NuoK [Spirochaetes bacterium]|nr:NADH-quinone oxidoreductase subunit NuoK [Spirochaetota bacterium]
MTFTTLTSELSVYLIIGAALFVIGLIGMLRRRNYIGMLIASELILAGASLNFMAFSRFGAADAVAGQVFTLFIMGIAAAEAAIGLSVVVAVYRHFRSIATDDTKDMKG